MTLYEITQALITTPGNNDKLAILQANKDDPLAQAFFKAMLDPAVNYYITKLPKVAPCPEAGGLDMSILEGLRQDIAGRIYTGSRATSLLKLVMANLNAEGQKLLEYIIKRQIPKSKVGDSMVLKTWPGLFFIPPYMRCSSMDASVVEYYRAKHRFYVQPKRDGSFAYGIHDAGASGLSLCTRTGNYYPRWFAEHILLGLPKDTVLVGELEVYARVEDNAARWELLDRKTGNGILNSIMQGEDEAAFHEYEFHYVAWDSLFIEEFKSGKSNREYFERLGNVEWLNDTGKMDCMQLIETHEVDSVEKAFDINTELTAAGKEGTVWKTLHGKWKDTSSGTKDAVKLKVKFQAEYKVTGYYEGEGKAEGMLGGLEVETEDKLLETNVGSGFSDEQRKELWANRLALSGQIVTLEANDVIANKNRPGVMALSLPIFEEFRFDRKAADTLARVIEQRDAARMGGK